MDNKFIVQVFLEACRKADFQDKWMSAATWAEIVCRHYNLGVDVAFDGTKLTQAIGRDKALNSLIEGNNGQINEHVSLYRNKYRPKGLSKQIYCFYATRKGERPDGIDATSQWHTNISSATDLLQKRVTRNTTLKFESSQINEAIELKKLEEDTTLGKRKRPQTHGNLSECSLKAANVIVLDNSSSSTKELSSLAQFPIVCSRFCFWDSPEACTLFKPVENETVLDAVNNQIEVLAEANKSDFGYTELIENLHEFNLADANTYQGFCLHQKCMCLSLALVLAKENMNNWTWKKCCEEAIAILKKNGMRLTKNPQTIMEWYRKFRVKRKFTMLIKKTSYHHS